MVSNTIQLKLTTIAAGKKYKTDKLDYDGIIARDKTSLDIFWIKDKSLTDLDNLPEPDILAQEIIDNIESALGSFKEIITELDEK